MKNLLKFSVIALAALTMASCCNRNECKFSAKEYAKRETAKLNDIVKLDASQEKAVYSLYLEQGKNIQKAIKEGRKHDGDMKRPDRAPQGSECGPKMNCASCDQAADCVKEGMAAAKPEGKPDAVKPAGKGCPECTKAECCKAECKGDCKDCPKVAGKPECCQAECKGECKDCPKVAGKPECEVNCMMKGGHGHRPMISREERQEFRQKLNTILTPEQQALLKSACAKRHACRNIPEQAEATPAAETQPAAQQAAPATK